MLGLTIRTLDEIAADEARQLDLGEYEDMAAQHKRYRKRSGSQEAVTLASDKDMPNNADADKWARFHAQKTSSMTGGFDPCSIIR